MFLLFASGALREVTLSRAPLRRPVCPIPKGSHSSHRPDVCLHPCVQVWDSESCSPRQADFNHELGALAADLCSRSPCSSTLLPGVVSSTRQVNNPVCYWIVKNISHILKPHATELRLPCLPQGLSSSVLLEFKKGMSSRVPLVHLWDSVLLSTDASCEPAVPPLSFTSLLIFTSDS